MNDYSNNTLVTNFDHSGIDVMVFSSEEITHKNIKTALDLKLKHYDDVIEVKTEDCQFYIYEPCWLQPEAETNILKLPKTDKPSW